MTLRELIAELLKQEDLDKRVLIQGDEYPNNPAYYRPKLSSYGPDEIAYFELSIENMEDLYED